MVRTSPLVIHLNTHHSGMNPNFKMEVLRTFKDPLSRQIEEASRIKGTVSNTLYMDIRAEWRSTPLPQLVVPKGRVAPSTVPTFYQAPGIAGRGH